MAGFTVVTVHLVLVW